MTTILRSRRRVSSLLQGMARNMTQATPNTQRPTGARQASPLLVPPGANVCQSTCGPEGLGTAGRAERQARSSRATLPSAPRADDAPGAGDGTNLAISRRPHPRLRRPVPPPGTAARPPGPESAPRLVQPPAALHDQALHRVLDGRLGELRFGIHGELAVVFPGDDVVDGLRADQRSARGVDRPSLVEEEPRLLAGAGSPQLDADRLAAVPQRLREVQEGEDGEGRGEVAPRRLRGRPDSGA